MGTSCINCNVGCGITFDKGGSAVKCTCHNTLPTISYESLHKKNNEKEEKKTILLLSTNMFFEIFMMLGNIDLHLFLHSLKGDAYRVFTGFWYWIFELHDWTNRRRLAHSKGGKWKIHKVK